MMHFTLFKKRYTGETFEEISKEFRQVRDESNRTSESFPMPKVYDGEKEIGWISYNGNIWPLGTRTNETIPLYPLDLW
jgi:hypothetical protein